MSGAPARLLHAERTADPAVLRWVLHHPRLAAASPGSRVVPPDSPLGPLVADGSIVAVVVSGGDALVRAGDPNRWPEIAPEVRRALLAELDRFDDGGAGWLLDVAGDASYVPEIAEIQRIVDRAAGSSMTMHGGTMLVTAVSETTVHLRAQGACDGCQQSDVTMLELIRPAISAAHSTITDVVLDRQTEHAPPAGASDTRSVAPPKLLRRGRSGKACH